MKGQKTVPNDDVKECIFRLMDMTHEDYKNTYDPCLNRDGITIQKII